MPFKQGKTPALVIRKKDVGRTVAALAVSGYEIHDRMTVKRRNEKITLRRRFRSGSDWRQVHVQIDIKDGHAFIYAHTEPAAEERVLHIVEGLLDMACFQAGSRMLHRDLARGKKNL